METFQKVQQILKREKDKDPEEVHLNTSFVDDLNMDSLDMVELVMAIEEEFDIEIPDEDAEKFNTVQQVIDYLQQKGTPE